MILLELLRLAAARGAGTEGTDLFIGAVPAAVEGAALFAQTGGRVDTDLLGHRRLSFQVFARDRDYTLAHDRAQALMAACTVRQQPIGAYWVTQCYPRHEPYPMGREDGGFYTFVQNFDAVWRTA